MNAKNITYKATPLGLLNLSHTLKLERTKDGDLKIVFLPTFSTDFYSH